MINHYRCYPMFALLTINHQITIRPVHLTRAGHWSRMSRLDWAQTRVATQGQGDPQLQVIHRCGHHTVGNRRGTSSVMYTNHTGKIYGPIWSSTCKHYHGFYFSDTSVDGTPAVPVVISMTVAPSCGPGSESLSDSPTILADCDGDMERMLRKRDIDWDLHLTESTCELG